MRTLHIYSYSTAILFNDRSDSNAVGYTLKLVLNCYNEETNAEAKALLNDKVPSGKMVINIQGVRKSRETLKDISPMIQGTDAGPNNSIRLVTEISDFPSLDMKNIDAASHYQKIIQLSKQVEQQRDAKNAAVMRT